ncbi:MAG: prepilin-type N-terminal cleavage/methylation domain-containing protein [Phycisphaerae bacterium]|nr:prepilin-type N-terminal cleavage/methylation domain-containing protein [Phycisphaerae bacterium]
MRMRVAFTLMELMIVVAIAAIIFVASVTGEDSTENESIKQFTEKLDGDVSYARSLSIANPLDPVVVKVDPESDKYWLAKKAAPDTPIANPADKKPYVVALGQNPQAKGIMRRLSIAATDLGDDKMLEFDSMGTLKRSDAATIRLAIGERAVDIQVVPQASRTTKITASVDALADDGSGKLVREESADGEIATETNTADANDKGLIESILGGLGL